MIVVVVIVTALVFDFTNGFHDTANAMATSIATRALRPRVAVGLSAALNLAGAFVSVEVARTISSGLVDERVITPPVIFGGLVAAILWNVLTWLLGLPSSSSHALFGGLIGATWLAAGASAVRFGAIVEKVLMPAVAAPLVAGLVTGLATYLLYRITRNRDRAVVRGGFRRAQIVSASLVSLSHGANDAQKTMGVITLTLITAGSLPADAAPPLWVIVSAGLVIAIGTYFGGWRIIRTVGHRLTDIDPQQGFAAETASAAVILTSSQFGYPLSTTHVTSGAVVGSGVGRRLAEVHWDIAGRIAAAWLLTLPAAAVIGAMAGWLALAGTYGLTVVAVLLIAAGVAMYLISRHNPVDADNINEAGPDSVNRETTTA